MDRMQLRLVDSRKAEKAPAKKEALPSFTTIDLFCGAGGITEGFHQAGYRCLYGNDCMPEAIRTFSFNHPKTWSDGRDIEEVEPRKYAELLA
jgi:DNA (cytosine-5)-methyltransferase 1